MNGWIKLHRDIRNCWIWQIDTPFDERSAWIDLLLLANHHDKKLYIDGELKTIERGQFVTSILGLSERWGWNKKRTSKFLNILENDKMITQKRTTHGTTVSVVNYSFYQDCGSTDGTTDGQPLTQPMDSHGTTTYPTEGKPMDTNKNIKNIKNVKKDKNVKNKRNSNINNINSLDNLININNTDNNLSVSYETDCLTKNVRLIMSLWNELEQYGIKAISRINNPSKRYDRLTARIKQYGVEDVINAIDKIKESDFLQGKNNQGWVITFDWFILPNNFPKVLEGNYDNNGNHKKSGSAYMDAIQNRVSEVDNWT